MRVELGAPVVLVDVAPTLWHIPTPEDHERTLCGLAGDVFAYRGPVRARCLCKVCARRAPAIVHDPTAGTLEELEHKLRRRGGRPKGSVRLLTELQVRALHLVYVEQRLSCRQLARRIDWQALGYASTASAANAIDKAFRDLELPLRSHHDALVLRNHRHGRCTRELRAAGGDYGPDGYRSWLRRERGEYRPLCAGVRTQYPRKGAPCQHPAMAGSEYCYSHDPARAAERDAHLERAREQLFEAAA